MTNRKKLACLITGVPRGYQRCLPTLRFLLDDYEVDYFAVMRLEFATEAVMKELKQLLPGIQIIIVPPSETENTALALASKLNQASTVLQMWHEVWYGTNAIPDLAHYDLVFRSRFDVRFVPQFLPEIDPSDSAVWIPEQLSWSGTNDMLCLASPPAFKQYARTFLNTETLTQSGARAAEHFSSQSLALLGLEEKPLRVYFILYREVIHSVFDDASLDVVSLVRPGMSIYKVGRPKDTPEARARVTRDTKALVGNECRFPLYGIQHSTSAHHPADVDIRDNTIFRLIDVHFQMRRALKDVCGIRFKLHHRVKGWNTDMLSVVIDNHPIKMAVASVDEFNRPTLYGEVDPNMKFRRPWSKIGIASVGPQAFARVDPNSKDKRQFSIGIGVPEFERSDAPWERFTVPPEVMLQLEDDDLPREGASGKGGLILRLWDGVLRLCRIK